jgi:hypothetical protein
VTNLTKFKGAILKNYATKKKWVIFANNDSTSNSLRTVENTENTENSGSAGAGQEVRTGGKLFLSAAVRNAA